MSAASWKYWGELQDISQILFNTLLILGYLRVTILFIKFIKTLCATTCEWNFPCRSAIRWPWESQVTHKTKLQVIAVLPEYFDGQLYFVDIKLLILEKQFKEMLTAMRHIIMVSKVLRCSGAHCQSVEKLEETLTLFIKRSWQGFFYSLHSQSFMWKVSSAWLYC